MARNVIKRHKDCTVWFNAVNVGGNNLSGTELAFLDGVTAGTATASKAVVLGASKEIATITTATITNLTSTAAGITTLTCPTVGTAAAGLTLVSKTPMSIKLDNTNALQLDNAAIASFAGAADTAGTDVYIETQDGGAATAAGAASGAFNIKTGDGSAAAGSGDDAGGAASDIDLEGGAGGAGGTTNGAGGAGANINLTPGAGGAGAGSGLAGLPGAVKIGAGLFFQQVQTIDMADAAVSLAVTPTASHTTLTGNILYVDANSSATENLELPPEADSTGLVLVIQNTGGETIEVLDDAGSNPGNGACSLLTTEACIAICDGTTWNVHNWA
jgi:hypothetical protein